MFDVIEVDIDTRKITIMGQGKDEKNAEAILKMAIMRRATDDNFFTLVEAGKYADGDTLSDEATQ